MDLYSIYENRVEDLILEYSEPNHEYYEEIFGTNGITAEDFDDFVSNFFSYFSDSLSEGLYHTPFVEELLKDVAKESFASYFDSRKELLTLICKDCGFSSVENSFFSHDIKMKNVKAIECGIYMYFIERLRGYAYRNNSIMSNLKRFYKYMEDKDFKESTNKTAWKYNNLLRG